MIFLKPGPADLPEEFAPENPFIGRYKKKSKW